MAVQNLAKTITFTATSAGAAITVQTRCRKIEIWEKTGSVQVQHAAPTSTDTQVPLNPGVPLVLMRPSPGGYGFGVTGDPGYYQPGDTVGWIFANTGTVTICQRETI